MPSPILVLTRNYLLVFIVIFQGLAMGALDAGKKIQTVKIEETEK